MRARMLLVGVLALISVPGARPAGAAAAGSAVILVVNDLLLPEISAEVNRLQADLVAAGHAGSKITPWSGGSAQDLWNYLKGEYATGTLRGAILIGQIPVAWSNQPNYWAYGYTDLCYFNMTGSFGDSYPSTYRIWVSRMWALEWYSQTESFFGKEVELLKRALQANHDYRTGASRLPHRATWWCSGDFTGWLTQSGVSSTLKNIWPTVENVDPLGAFIAGAEFHEEISHGGDTGYGGGVDSVTVQELLVQTRFVSSDSCSSGALGGIVNNINLTRGGGNVLSMGASTITGAGWYLPSNNSQFCSKLAAGSSWGDAMVTNYCLVDSSNSMFYGDLSLKPKMSPANALPYVGSLTASATTGVAPFTVNFNATAADPDGSIAQAEWFTKGFHFGKVAPDATGMSATATYTLPHRYWARIQVADNARASAGGEVEINVLPRSDQPFRVACGRRSSPALYPYTNINYHGDLKLNSYYNIGADYTDSQGRLWLHDQMNYLWPYVPSYNWGFSDPTYGADRVLWVPTTVAGTSDSELYQLGREDAYRTGFTYTVPLADGGYTLNLGFADCKSTAAGQRTADITVQGAPWLTGYDAFAAAGGGRATGVSTHVQVTGGLLTFVVKTNPGSVESAFLNCFEVIPDVGAPSNMAPVIVAGPSASPEAVALPATTTVSVAANDADGGPAPLTYAWSMVSGPGTVSFSPNSTSAASLSTASFSAAGSYTLRVTVSDGAASVSGDVIVTATSSSPGPLTLTASATSVAAGAALGCAWSNVPNPTPNDCIELTGNGASHGIWGTGSAASGSLTTTAPAAAGQYEFKYWSYDVANSTWVLLATSSSITVTAAPNGTPTITVQATAAPNPAQVGQAVVFSVSATDPEADPLSYAWDFGDGFSVAGASATHAYAAGGTYTATVWVSDGKGGTVNGSIVVAVSSGPADTTPPTVSITSPAAGGTVARRSTVLVTATASDDVGVSKVELYVNGVLTGTSTTAPYNFTWSVGGKPRGTYRLQVNAYDGAGNAGTSSVTVTSR
jgi:hypothetical protein